MKTYKYKTLKGFLNNCSHSISIEELFTGRTYHNKAKKNISFELSEDAKLEAAKGFSEYARTSKKAQAKLLNSLLDRYSDFSFLQCFFITQRGNKYYFSNCLSGEAFEYCLRSFCK